MALVGSCGVRDFYGRLCTCHNAFYSCRVRETFRFRYFDMQTNGDHDGGLYAGMGVYERKAGCRKSRRGYEDGSLYGCDDNDIRDTAAAVWFGAAD